MHEMKSYSRSMQKSHFHLEDYPPLFLSKQHRSFNSFFFFSFLFLATLTLSISSVVSAGAVCYQEDECFVFL